MSAAHTPGPWSVVDRTHVCTASLQTVAVAQHSRESAANARLIAAAPDLLETLEGLIEAAESMLGTCGCIRGKTPEHDDMHIHEEWAEKFLNERLQETVAVIAKATGAAA